MTENKSFEQYASLRELARNCDLRKIIPTDVNESRIFEVALDTVGGVENSIADGAWEGDEPTVSMLVSMAMDDVFSENPREVRFVGKERAEVLCEIAAATFNA